jgi:hypothetical protein
MIVTIIFPISQKVKTLPDGGTVHYPDMKGI